ncbi:MAG: hypothetical protein V8Q79_02955 [Christensenellales bacterium]
MLIMSPWNYPFMLLMEPLIGALLPQATAASSSRRHIRPRPPPSSASWSPPASRGKERRRRRRRTRRRIKALLHQRFDYIFFTGGVAVGKEVMRARQRNI